MQKARLHRAILENSRAVYKIAMVILRNPDDADDALQETFLQYFKKNPQFESPEQEKVWLIRCAVNVSKNMRRTIFRHSHEPLREEMAAPAPGTLPDLLFSLPLKDRMILQLRYVEGYSSEEIAQMLHLSSATVRKRLERARNRAKTIYEKEYL